MMHAIVLAAGLGTRMREVTDAPKPLVKVAGKSLLDYALDSVERAGIHEAVVNVSYRADAIIDHLKNRSAPTIIISHEEEPLETGGGIVKALPLLGNGPFFAMNSDAIVVDGPASALTTLQDNWTEDVDALLLLHPTHKAYGYSGKGDFVLNAKGQIRRRREGEMAPAVFTGTQLLHPRFFNNAPAGKFSMNLLYDKTRDAEGWMHTVRAVMHTGDWLHVGDRAGLEQAGKFLGAIS